MVNEAGIIKKELKEIKKKLRTNGFTYFNQYLSVDLLLSIYQNHIILNGEVVVNFEKISDNNFYSRFCNNAEFVKSDSNGKVVFSKEINKILKEQFESLDNALKSSCLDDVKAEENNDTAITNLISAEEYEKAEGVKIEAKNKDIVFIPNRTLELGNIHTLMNKYDDFEFRLNKNIKIKEDIDFNFNRINVVKKFIINVKNKVFQSDRIEKICSEFMFTCPRCFNKIFLLPNETYTTVKHPCPGWVNSQGNQMYTPMLKECRAASNSKQVYLYEFTIGRETTSRYAYSFLPDIIPGKYRADILLTVDSLNAETKKNLALILGMEKEEANLEEHFFSDKQAKEWCKERNFPHIRLLDAIFSIRKLHENYTFHKINDKGMLNQIFVVSSALAKILFNNRCFGISVKGNKSLSKTYVGYMFAMPMDRDFIYIQNSTDISIPGLKGGINNRKDINGEITTIFEEGIFSRGGLTIFDEGDKFYSDPILNSSLKDLFNTKINIQKIGGKQGIPQNYTPLIYSNFTISHVNYINYVQNAYSLIIRPLEARVPHEKKETEIIRYLNSINLYLPLGYYVDTEKNEFLAKAISHVRESLKSKDIDWKTGGSVPSSYRILFEVVCYNREETFDRAKKRVSERTEVVLPEIYDIPFEDFQIDLKQYYNINGIDLYKFQNNTKEVNDRLKKLFKAIDNFLITDGVDIHIHLSNNCKSIDEKLASLVNTYIAMLQLLEDPTSTELSDSVKFWSKLILLKCKRGVTEDEYDFKEHTNYKFVRYELNETIGDIKAMKEDRDMANLVDKMIKKTGNDGIEVDLKTEES
jgi:hypothetical protein